MKKVAKASKRRLVFFGPLAIIIIGYFCVSIFTYTYKIYSLNKEKERLTNELESLQEKEQNLKIEIQKLKDPEYVARYAREHYLYTKDGEYVIKIETSKEKIEQENLTEIDYKYIIGISGIGLLIILLILTRKKKPKGKVK